MRVIYWAKLKLARRQVAEKLTAVAGAEIVVVETLHELLQALPGAVGLVLYDAPQDEAHAVVQALKTEGSTVRWIHFLTAGREGFEAVGLPAGPAITWAAGGVSPAVAEHAMALLLALVRRVPEMVELTSAHKWDRGIAARASSLEGGVMALIGLGHVGGEVARRARAFGMKVIAVTRTPKIDPLVDEVYPLSELGPVLARADAIVVAIAMSAATAHLLGRDAFSACKPGALLVNIARGGVIDQVALRDALLDGRIGGAGLDVTDPEPLPGDDPLWSAPNLLVSPHFAGAGSRASLERLADGAAENLRRLLDGRSLLNRID